jgi:hypothetical protein
MLQSSKQPHRPSWKSLWSLPTVGIQAVSGVVLMGLLYILPPSRVSLQPLLAAVPQPSEDAVLAQRYNPLPVLLRRGLEPLEASRMSA